MHQHQRALVIKGAYQGMRTVAYLHQHLLHKRCGKLAPPNEANSCIQGTGDVIAKDQLRRRLSACVLLRFRSPHKKCRGCTV